MLATTLHGSSLGLSSYDASMAALPEAADTSKLRALPLDTRAYQELEPLRLPPKLRDRITRAQRRAAAEKDGVSIFTATAAILAEAKDNHRQSTTTLATVSSAIADDRRASTTTSKRRASQLPSQVPAKDKMHLPDVILSHKMREFEAKMSANALFVDPLENNLHHLTIEEKEQVMLTMQDKIQAITAQVDAHFVQLKDELDAHGIFDSAANYQRAQALCLVELQKRCKLEKIRDDAVKHVLGQGGDDSEKSLSHMKGKLNELLAQKQREADRLEDTTKDHTTLEAARSMAMQHVQQMTQSSAMKRRSGVPATHKKRTLSPVKRHHQLSRHVSNQAADPEAGSVVDADAAISVSAATAVSTATEDWASRHPHIAQVLQVLSTSHAEAAGLVSAESLDSWSSRESTLEDDSTSASGHGCVVTMAEEWAERSSSYQAIAHRVCTELVVRCARWRWDTTKQFENDPVDGRFRGVSVALLQRLRRRRETATARLREEDEQRRALQLSETNADKRKKADAAYQQLQEKIQSKRQRAVMMARTLARASTAGSRTAPLAGASTRRATTSEGGSRRQPGDAEPVSGDKPMVQSASAPGLALPASGAPALSREEERRRSLLNSLLENKLPALLSRSKSVRQYSRIGAPVCMDLTTLGHHSNTRIEERRSSAQTWAWLHPQRMIQLETGRLHEEGKRIQCKDDDDDSDVDASERRDAMAAVDEDGEDSENDNEENDDNDGGSDAASVGGSEDDARSVRSSMSSARSAFSVVSKAGGTHAHTHSHSHTHAASIPEHRSKSKNTTRTPQKTKGSRGRRSPTRRTSSAVKGPRGSHLSSRISFGSSASGSSGGGMFATIHFTANAQVLQHRLEEIWRVLEFPFSSRLLMLEKYADLSDTDAFARALGEWEAVLDMVAIREKLKHVLAEYDELNDVKASSRLTPADWSYLLAQQVEIPPNAISLSTTDFVEWIHEHIDSVTQRCEKMAQQLKVKTGDELTFQGQRYPPRV